MIPVDEPDWFEADIVNSIQARQIAEHGGQPGIRDEGMLESALVAMVSASTRLRPKRLAILCMFSPVPDEHFSFSAYWMR